jgi:uncharacterized protein (DUF2062 family)
MIGVTRAMAARWLERLLHAHDTPGRTAAAFALGVFIGFSPLVGLHTVLGLALAFLFDLNRVAVLLGVYTNLPWIMGPYYALATALGASLLGVKVPATLPDDLKTLFQHWSPKAIPALGHLLERFAWSFALGSTLMAGAAAALAYLAAYAFITTRRSAARRPA